MVQLKKYRLGGIKMTDKIEKRLNELRGMEISYEELKEEIKELGFELVADEDTEFGWDNDGNYDTAIVISPRIWKKVQMDYYCEATHRRERFSTEEIIDKIIMVIEWFYEHVKEADEAAAEVYEKILHEEYLYKETENLSLDEKLAAIDARWGEKVRPEFLDKLEKAGIDLYKIENEIYINYIYFTDQEWSKGITEELVNLVREHIEEEDEWDRCVCSYDKTDKRWDTLGGVCRSLKRILKL